MLWFLIFFTFFTKYLPCLRKLKFDGMHDNGTLRALCYPYPRLNVIRKSVWNSPSIQNRIRWYMYEPTNFHSWVENSSFTLKWITDHVLQKNIGSSFQITIEIRNFYRTWSKLHNFKVKVLMQPIKYNCRRFGLMI